MESNDLGSLMRFLHDDGEYHKTGLTITETSKKLAPSAKVPQQTPVQNKPNVDHEALGVETYEDEDLTKVKSQTPKNKKFAVRKVADKEVETPIPVVKPPAKESKVGTLYLCNECNKTFRSAEAECPLCFSNIVEKIVKEDVETLPAQKPKETPWEEPSEEPASPYRTKRSRPVTPLKPEPGQNPEPKGENPDVVLFKKVRRGER